MTENAACGLAAAVRLSDLVTPSVQHVEWDELGAAEHARLRHLFRTDVYPLLTPFVVDATHPFPPIAAFSLTLCVLVRDPFSGVTRFAGVQIPSRAPRHIGVDDRRRIGIDTLLAALLQEVFPGVRILERSTFRLGRVENPDGDRAVVRLDVEDSISQRMLAILVRNLGLSDGQVHRVPAPLGSAALGIATRQQAVAGAARPRSGRTETLFDRA